MDTNLDANAARAQYIAIRKETAQLAGFRARTFDDRAKRIVEGWKEDRKATEIKPIWWVYAAQFLKSDISYDVRHPTRAARDNEAGLY